MDLVKIFGVKLGIGIFHHLVCVWTTVCGLGAELFVQFEPFLFVRHLGSHYSAAYVLPYCY
jgi:hypothetical protein